MTGISKSLRSSSNFFLRTHEIQTRFFSQNFIKYAGQTHGPPLCINHDHLTKARYLGYFANTNCFGSGLDSSVDTIRNKMNRVNIISSAFSNSCLRSSAPLISTVNLFNRRSYSSFFSSIKNESSETNISAVSGSSEPNASDSGVVDNDLFDKVKDVWKSTVDAVTYTGHKAKEASNELAPHVQQLFDTYPFLNTVVVPVSVTLTATVLAWVVMPSVLRRFHNYAMKGSAALLHGNLSGEQVPYEKSFWGALEDPVRYLITFMAFSQIGMMVAPTTIAAQYIQPAWRGAVILSFVWVLHRWKKNVIDRALSSQTLAGIDRDKLLGLDRLSSVGLFVLGVMAFAEACGVAVQSILTVGGIGGVATAFAAKDILGNVLSGLSMQFSKPFSLGDTIKAGSIEGQVVEMGLTATSLLNAEKFPVIVPNSLFSSQVIVNKSRAHFRAMVTKIPLQIGTLEKIPEITEDIKTTIRSNANVFLGKEIPYCFLSRIESSFAELTIGCNLKQMSKNDLYSSQQDILIQCVEIIKKHGGTLGSSQQDTASQ